MENFEKLKEYGLCFFSQDIRKNLFLSLSLENSSPDTVSFQDILCLTPHLRLDNVLELFFLVLKCNQMKLVCNTAEVFALIITLAVSQLAVQLHKPNFNCMSSID